MEPSGFDYVARQISVYGDLLLTVPAWVKEQAFDIHIAAGQSVSISGREGILFLKRGGVSQFPQEGVATTAAQVRELFLQACGYSVFRHQEEIRRGFVQMGSNCRVGLCGSAVSEKGQILSVRDITALVYRIPRQVIGCGDRLFLEGVPIEEGILVAGPPSSGKTTFLRDVARSLSLGRFGPSRRVAVVDERGELGGFDLGPNTDLLHGYPKAAGLDVAVRTLSPEIIVCDELSQGDLDALKGAAASGAALVASVHGEAGRLLQRPLCRELLETGAFGTAVCLSGRSTPGKIESIQRIRERGGEAVEASGGHSACSQRSNRRRAGSGSAAAPGTDAA